MSVAANSVLVASSDTLDGYFADNIVSDVLFFLSFMLHIHDATQVYIYMFKMQLIRRTNVHVKKYFAVVVYREIDVMPDDR